MIQPPKTRSAPQLSTQRVPPAVPVSQAREHVAADGDATRWGSPHGRLSGAFWVVRERPDGAGTDLVSEEEDGPCAVGLGMSTSLAELASRSGLRLPLLMVLTLLPFRRSDATASHRE